MSNTYAGGIYLVAASKDGRTEVAAPRKFSPSRNRPLAAMSAADLALLQPHLRPVAMPVFKEMERPNRRIETIYFMEAGIASVVSVQSGETQAEVGLIGREGMSGIALLSDSPGHSSSPQAGRQKFFPSISFSVDASSSASAKSFFSRRFSSSRAFSLRASEIVHVLGL